MPRTNRFFLPDSAWHLTLRCHERDFLLKFHRDRQRVITLLYEAKKRYGLVVLNYMVTANHLHLLAFTGDDGLSISRSMQFVAGRIGQEFNQRKKRSGGFWEDRYHATAVESGAHLSRCLVYIHLNMVRAGAVSHPADWQACGYHEIMRAPKRYRIINRQLLGRLVGLEDEVALPAWQAAQVAAVLSSGENLARRPELTESLAVGSRAFVGKVSRHLARNGFVKTIDGTDEDSLLREGKNAYSAVLGAENGRLRLENTLCWGDDR